MEKIQLIGLDLQSAIQHTKTCLTDTLSPVKKDAVARSFLKRFLRAENEHTLPQHFINETNKKQYVICLNELDFDSKIESQTFSITSSASLSDDLKTVFKAHFYLNEYIIDDILNSDLIEDFIYKNNLDENAIYDQIKQMDEKTLFDWLINNFELSQLVDDSFFCEVLNSGSTAIVVCLTFSPENTLFTSYAPNADD